MPRREVREYSSLPRHRSSADYPSLSRDGAHHGHSDHVHTDSGVGTQDEAEHAEPLDLVRTMLERARQREDALRSVAAPPSLSLSQLGLNTPTQHGAAANNSAAPLSSPDLFSRRQRVKPGVKGRRRRAVTLGAVTGAPPPAAPPPAAASTAPLQPLLEWGE